MVNPIKTNIIDCEGKKTKYQCKECKRYYNDLSDANICCTPLDADDYIKI